MCHGRKPSLGDVASEHAPGFGYELSRSAVEPGSTLFVSFSVLSTSGPSSSACYWWRAGVSEKKRN